MSGQARQGSRAGRSVLFGLGLALAAGSVDGLGIEWGTGTDWTGLVTLGWTGGILSRLVVWVGGIPSDWGGTLEDSQLGTDKNWTWWPGGLGWRVLSPGTRMLYEKLVASKSTRTARLLPMPAGTTAPVVGQGHSLHLLPRAAFGGRIPTYTTHYHLPIYSCTSSLLTLTYHTLYFPPAY